MLFFGNFLYTTPLPPPFNDPHPPPPPPPKPNPNFYSQLLINAVAILSEDRFLARSEPHHPPHTSRSAVNHIDCVSLVNLSPASYDPAFGSGADASIKAKIIHLIASIRTIMRSTSPVTALLSSENASYGPSLTRITFAIQCR
ncbi:hypothetical protein BGZ63DRAFT_458772 [Mariannaea sp. PMI_226]|nr:hypothetical protein BGZ63DRAFT_458772 [Mariannaea sp. PMI_226]